MKGDADRGRAVFRKNCATCHRLEGVGFETGLPLTNLQNKGAEFVLVNILDPNLQVLPNYIGYVCVLKDGRTVTGIISSETANSITLLRAEGVSETVLRANIDRLESTGMSLMPEGLEKQVDRREMADLIEYLLNVRG
jgi:putative heme-binding domain-containing protein